MKNNIRSLLTASNKQNQSQQNESQQFENQRLENQKKLNEQLIQQKNDQQINDQQSKAQSGNKEDIAKNLRNAVILSEIISQPLCKTRLGRRNQQTIRTERI